MPLDRRALLVSALGYVMFALSTVLKASGEWQVLAVNDLGEEIRATPALSGGRIYVRTHDSLYCFGAAH